MINSTFWENLRDFKYYQTKNKPSCPRSLAHFGG